MPPSTEQRLPFEAPIYEMEARLGDMEAGLDREFFFRVNSSTIVNLDKVTHFTTSPTGLFVAGLPDGTAAEFSPDRSRIFQERYEL